MNTMINLFVPMYFAAPGLIVNTLFFVQGIGTTAFYTWQVDCSGLKDFLLCLMLL